MLEIVKHIKKYGFEKTIDKFNLKYKDYPNKVIIKYDQINSDMSQSEVQEARGLILEKGTWKVLSLAFKKFFNASEGYAAKIDWNTAHILEKIDGSLIHVYWDWNDNKWYAATSGMAEGEGLVNNKSNTSFSDLFWGTIKEKYDIKEMTDRMNKKSVYIFELTTPYNIVVKPHGESSVTLIGVRIRETLKEVDYEGLKHAAMVLKVPVVKRYDLNNPNVGKLLKTFEEMPWHEEGYVVVDGDFNRIKIKNPAYVQIHHLKSKTAEHNIMGVVKSNEIEEFAATFKERKEEVFDLKDKYDKLVNTLKVAWDEISKPKNITAKERKKFAFAVNDIVNKYDLHIFRGMFFGLQDGKIKDIDSYIFNFDDKKLYNYL